MLKTTMANDLVFMMGEYPAHIPVDRYYSTNHLWLKEVDTYYLVGLTAYSVRLLQDVYFLDWSIDSQTQVKAKQSIGEVESSKALSDLYAPAAGIILQFNDQLLDDPSFINTDGYGNGWLYQFQTDQELLSPEEYLQLLDEGWEKTQNMLKGQMN